MSFLGHQKESCFLEISKTILSQVLKNLPCIPHNINVLPIYIYLYIRTKNIYIIYCMDLSKRMDTRLNPSITQQLNSTKPFQLISTNNYIDSCNNDCINGFILVSVLFLTGQSNIFPSCFKLFVF